ncbi:hypothetical protein VTJ83DRAFT_4740 [Remersonia thermophila]|uniref:SET domain-containing protein n=1 Tax=Remersonia thermophila TaxID=72144 RepID=A0ABR4DAV5_9PEZI
MTDNGPPLPTSIASPSQPPARKQEPAEEEPYTIKCICDFPDDDGNTIYCDTCDTWQHIECYYPDNAEDAVQPNFEHSCTDCDPRYIDREQAIARQRARGALPPVEAAAEKKAKRPPSKSHKKKAKPSDLHINGGGHGASDAAKHLSPGDANPHPPKKAKSSHKSSQSISSQAPKRNASNHGAAKATNGHPLSPATTPPDLPDDFELYKYSTGFVSLYSDDSYQIVNTNSFADIRVSNTMTNWLHSREQLKKETGLSYSDVFQDLPANMEAMQVVPEVEQARKVVSPANVVVQCYSLRAPSSIKEYVPLMEVNGQIGFQASYCADPDNRWSELTAPLPFVLFHPLLPLYIDTRREGSEARFVRRSCRPNATLETYISSDNQYRFWLVSDRPVAAKEPITIGWDFRFPVAEKARALQLFGLGDDASGAQAEQSAVTDEDYQRWAPWVHLILSEYGGCACNLGPECAFARFHRNYLSKNAVYRAHPPPKPAAKKRKPKSQPQNAISPTSTGHATNSRAASEGQLDDAPDNDRRSVSSASRSKPPSRDRTPTARQGSFDTLGILTEPTDRDKRKVAMVEDTFRRMEQQQQQPQRKRKRASDGAAPAQLLPKASKPGSVGNTPNLAPSGLPERGYVDAGTATSRGKSGSPSRASPARGADVSKKPPRPGARSGPPGPAQPAPPPHVEYRDAAVQTDLPEPGATVTPRRKVGSCLRKRMLETWHLYRLEEERNKRRAMERPPSAATSVGSHGDGDAASPLSSPASTRDTDKPAAVAAPAIAATTTTTAAAAAAAAAASPLSSPQDHPMPDADATEAIEPAEPAETAQAAQTPTPAAKNKSLDLRVEPPPVPLFSSSSASAPSSASTPMSAGTASSQSPFSAGAAVPLPSPLAPSAVNGVATPSPVKKKLSLSDYKSRMNKAAAAAAAAAAASGKPLMGGAAGLLKPVSASSGTEEPKSATSVDGGVVSSPVVDKGEAATTSEAATATAAASPQQPSSLSS